MRSRITKPEIFKDTILGRIDIRATVLLQGLKALADRHGRLEDDPIRIKGEVFPYRRVPIEDLLKLLHNHNYILRYESKGINVIQVVGFAKEQRPYGNEQSYDLPAPPANFLDTIPEVPTDTGRHRDGSATPTPRPRHDCATTAPRLQTDESTSSTETSIATTVAAKVQADGESTLAQCAPPLLISYSHSYSHTHCTEASELVAAFYALWCVGVNFFPSPTSRELVLAQRIIETNGADRARSLMPFAVKRLRAGFPEAKTFLALERYIGAAEMDLKAQEKIQVARETQRASQEQDQLRDRQAAEEQALGEEVWSAMSADDRESAIDAAKKQRNWQHDPPRTILEAICKTDLGKKEAGSRSVVLKIVGDVGKIPKEERPTAMRGAVR